MDKREKEKETLNQQKKNGNEYNKLDKEGIIVASRSQRFLLYFYIIAIHSDYDDDFYTVTKVNFNPCYFFNLSIKRGKDFTRFKLNTISVSVTYIMWYCDM